MTGITLDTGALLGLERKSRAVHLLLQRALVGDHQVSIPATALAQAIRSPARQSRLSKLLQQANTNVVDLDRNEAIDVGRLLAASKTNDITDAHVAVVAMRRRDTIVTSDPDDFRLLAPGRPIVEV